LTKVFVRDIIDEALDRVIEECQSDPKLLRRQEIILIRSTVAHVEQLELEEAEGYIEYLNCYYNG
jgi:hypothetical protein